MQHRSAPWGLILRGLELGRSTGGGVASLAMMNDDAEPRPALLRTRVEGSERFQRLADTMPFGVTVFELEPGSVIGDAMGCNWNGAPRVPT